MSKKERKEESEDGEWFIEDKNNTVNIDENDLTQLPGIDTSLAKKLKREGYTSLWDIASAEVEDLVSIIRIPSKLAERMVVVANELLGF
jgi:predicted flap endonuclease-1-like 5' DNA nuclease